MNTREHLKTTLNSSFAACVDDVHLEIIFRTLDDFVGEDISEKDICK